MNEVVSNIRHNKWKSFYGFNLNYEKNLTTKNYTCRELFHIYIAIQTIESAMKIEIDINLNISVRIAGNKLVLRENNRTSVIKLENIKYVNCWGRKTIPAYVSNIFLLYIRSSQRFAEIILRKKLLLSEFP